MAPHEVKDYKKIYFNYQITESLYCFLSHWNESGANKNNESEKAFVKTKEYVRNMFGARIKIMCEKQLVDPPIDYII